MCRDLFARFGRFLVGSFVHSRGLHLRFGGGFSSSFGGLGFGHAYAVGISGQRFAAGLAGLVLGRNAVHAGLVIILGHGLRHRADAEYEADRNRDRAASEFAHSLSLSVRCVEVGPYCEYLSPYVRSRTERLLNRKIFRALHTLWMVSRTGRTQTTNSRRPALSQVVTEKIYQRMFDSARHPLGHVGKMTVTIDGISRTGS